ncbi:hypothetical protein CRG98_026471 [Punica granatum]|uniref:Uncharacterized protein n=1 Tax=Punica granatum TaxID=22663 RepID=A0A2I0JBX8_PUNGR|nr:hypothetical protein CRG98_026471 [Punica granatum]
MEEALSVRDYYDKLKVSWDELEFYLESPGCNCGAKNRIVAQRETEKVLWLPRRRGRRLLHGFSRQGRKQLGWKQYGKAVAHVWPTTFSGRAGLAREVGFGAVIRVGQTRGLLLREAELRIGASSRHNGVGPSASIVASRAIGYPASLKGRGQLEGREWASNSVQNDSKLLGRADSSNSAVQCAPMLSRGVQPRAAHGLGNWRHFPRPNFKRRLRPYSALR